MDQAHHERGVTYGTSGFNRMFLLDSHEWFHYFLVTSTTVRLQEAISLAGAVPFRTVLCGSN